MFGGLITMINRVVAALVDRLDDAELKKSEVIDWCSPVPVFGDISRSRVATVGINPSDREFVDSTGVELDGDHRRFHTLNSLSLSDWAQADFRHIRSIADSCMTYFLRNPYDRWFKVLDRVVWGTNSSFYAPIASACHLDLVPFATRKKWALLPEMNKTRLLNSSLGVLGILIRESPIEVLILNGRTVLTTFQQILGHGLSSREMAAWRLVRKHGRDVVGVSYVGRVDEIGGIDLGREILVLGFNHNLQSSYGITKDVIDSIREWVANSVGSLGSEA